MCWWIRLHIALGVPPLQPVEDHTGGKSQPDGPRRRWQREEGFVAARSEVLDVDQSRASVRARSALERFLHPNGVHTSRSRLDEHHRNRVRALLWLAPICSEHKSGVSPSHTRARYR